MEYTEAKKGRVFILRLQDGEILHKEIENFAQMQGITHGRVSIVGGIDKGSILVVGPEDGRAEKIKPMLHEIKDICEATGTGTLIPDENGNAILHMHISAGRKENTITGCVREGVIVWLIIEVIIEEFTNCKALRLKDKKSGFKLLTTNP
jgi:predicted DNA-binding protein with PD1-like motif